VKALVTGGAGFIGSNLVQCLVTLGHSVTVLDDLSTGYKANLDSASDVQLVEGDVCDGVLLDKVVDGCDVVFHLAASVGNQKSLDDPWGDLRTNGVGTLTLLEAVRRHRVNRLVVSSSAAIFGELRTLPIAEDHPTEPDSPYGCSKLYEEKVSLGYGRLYGIEVVCLRYFNVYGKNQRYDAYGNVIPKFVRLALRGEPLVIFGDGDQTRDFLNVSDVVTANVNAAMLPHPRGAYNVGSGTRVSINSLVSTLSKVVGRDLGRIHVSSRRGDVRDSVADISRAREELGFSPSVGLEIGLEEYVQWMKQTGEAEDET
jgi:nucleoside-diphosphate-sugar epimerase